MLIGILITVFVAFSISRAVLRYKDGNIRLGEFLFWIFIWGAIEVVVWIPKLLDRIAQDIGIGRGIDAVVYGAIVLLFYLVFRMYVKAEFIAREITEFVRKLALDKNKKDKPLN